MCMAVAVESHTGCVLRLNYRTHPPPPLFQPAEKSLSCDHPEIAGMVLMFMANMLSPKDRMMVRDNIALCSFCRAALQKLQGPREN